jgi:hypothetical protein
MKLTFVQVSAFAAKWNALGFNDEDLQALEAAIMERPTAGAVMSGTGGVRKVRFAPPSMHSGKSGATRVCYIVLIESAFCYLITLFAKSEKPNLTAAERKAMKQITELLRKAHREE